MKLSIVIPLYIPTHLLTKINEFLIPQLEAFDKFTDYPNLEIIYVANGCDFRVFETLVYLENQFPKLNIRTIWRDEALGYTVATNIGIQDCKGDIILLFNDDCILLSQPVNSWLNASLAPFNDPKVGIVTIHEQYCPYAEDWFGVGYYLLLRKTMLDQIGILDEIFSPGSGEDIDICLRAKRNGYSRVCIDESVEHPGKGFVVGYFPIWHSGEKSFHNWFAMNDMGGGRCEEIFKRNRGILRDRRLAGWYS